MLSKSRSHVAFVVSRAHRVRDRLLRARSVPSEDAKGCPVVAQGGGKKAERRCWCVRPCASGVSNCSFLLHLIFLYANVCFGGWQGRERVPG